GMVLPIMADGPGPGREAIDPGKLPHFQAVACRQQKFWPDKDTGAGAAGREFQPSDRQLGLIFRRMGGTGRQCRQKKQQHKAHADPLRAGHLPKRPFLYDQAWPIPFRLNGLRPSIFTIGARTQLGRNSITSGAKCQAYLTGLSPDFLALLAISLTDRISPPGVRIDRARSALTSSAAPSKSLYPSRS